MTEKLKVKISIADRVYPLTIDPATEEGLRKAAKLIEQNLKVLEKNYAVRDKQDVLAMCALQLATSSELVKLNAQQQTEAASQKLDELNIWLDNVLAQGA